MKGKKCRHKETGHIGIIKNELPATKNYPEQWGIYWFGGAEGAEHAKRIQQFGLQYYWQDKSKIEIVKENKDEKSIQSKISPRIR